MTGMQEMAGRIAALLREIVPELPAEIEPSASFEVLGVDSLQFTDLLMAVEREFGIEIPDSELPGLTHVADMADFVTAAVRTH